MQPPRRQILQQCDRHRGVLGGTLPHTENLIVTCPVHPKCHEDGVRPQEDGIDVDHEHSRVDRPLEELLHELPGGAGKLRTHRALRGAIALKVFWQPTVHYPVVPAGHCLSRPTRHNPELGIMSFMPTSA